MSDFNSLHNRVVWFDLPVADLDRAAIAQVRKLGGSVLQDAHPLGPHGWRAVVIDCEGNRIALHASQDP